MPLTLTNRVSSQALRGQSTTVTLDSTDSADLPNLNIGDICSINGGANFAIIYSIDLYGNSFKITPIQPDKNCSGFSFLGYLIAGDIVTI